MKDGVSKLNRQVFDFFNSGYIGQISNSVKICDFEKYLGECEDKTDMEEGWVTFSFLKHLVEVSTFEDNVFTIMINLYNFRSDMNIRDRVFVSIISYLSKYQMFDALKRELQLHKISYSRVDIGLADHTIIRFGDFLTLSFRNKVLEKISVIRNTM